MGCLNSKESIHGYYNASGVLVRFSKPASHHSKNEFEFVTQEDSAKFSPNEECYLVHALWLQSWLDYAMEKRTHPPNAISNIELLDSEGVNLRRNLKPKVDFRPVNRLVWEFLFRLYGGGPVIVFPVPSGLDEVHYKKGTWIKRIMFESVCTIIHPGSNPPPNDAQCEKNPMLGNGGGRGTTAGVHMEMTANHMLHDLGKAKMAKAKALDKEITQENADAIGALMAKDIGKRKMEEARKKEAEASQAAAEGAGHLFAGNLADKKAKEAKQAGAAASVAQTEQSAALFANMGAKKRFKEALKAGNIEVAEEAAAVMLQGAWRSRAARREVLELKARRQRLLKEACARKLQSKYRARLARKRVNALKAERLRLQEEGAAIMLQSSWRCRKARQKAARLKAEKQRLLEEGAALMLQSAWRIRQAKQRIAVLKQDRAAAEAEQQRAAELTAANRIYRAMRRLHARAQYRRRIMSMKHVVTLQLKGAMGINIADVNSSDPYVYIHVQSNLPPITGAEMGLSPNKAAVMKRRRSSAKGLDLKDTKTISMYRSKTIHNTLNPTWDEACAVTEVGFDDAIVLTLMDKDTLTKDDFLGQAVVFPSKYLDLYSGKDVTLNLLPIESYRCPARDAKGTVLTTSCIDTKGQGNMFLSFKLSPHARSKAGWVQKLAGSLLGGFGSQTFKTRYMVLTPDALKYFDDAHSLEHPRSVIPCKKVELLKYGPDKSGEMVLEVKGDGEEWYLKWTAGETVEGIAEWLRKIQCCCPQARLNDLEGDLAARLEASLGSRGKTRMNSSTLNLKPTSSFQRRATHILKKG